MRHSLGPMETLRFWAQWSPCEELKSRGNLGARSSRDPKKAHHVGEQGFDRRLDSSTTGPCKGQGMARIRPFMAEVSASSTPKASLASCHAVRHGLREKLVIREKLLQRAHRTWVQHKSPSHGWTRENPWESERGLFFQSRSMEPARRQPCCQHTSGGLLPLDKRNKSRRQVTGTRI